MYQVQIRMSSRLVIKMFVPRIIFLQKSFDNNKKKHNIVAFTQKLLLRIFNLIHQIFQKNYPLNN